MEKPTVSRRRELLCFWLRLICFALLTAAMLIYATYVLTPKHDYGICSMINLYRQEPDSIDVLAVDGLCERKVDVCTRLVRAPIALRWPVLLVLILVIAVFGMYGTGYNGADFLYTQF